MTSDEKKTTLLSLLANWENEVVEFKSGGKGFSSDEIGKYFSALSNEANLRGLESAWLVFGVHNKTRKVIGTDYDASPDAVNRSGGIKYQITQSTNPSVCFRNIHEIDMPDGRVVMFEIPPAPRGIPIAWKGHYYARSGENLMALGLEKLDAIRKQGQDSDWTAQIVDNATYDDLDEAALAYARRKYAEKHEKTVTPEEVAAWPLKTFLDRAHLTRDGRITRAALLLVGKELSAHLLSPNIAQLVWKLVGEEQANEIFYPPYVLATTALYSRIRNVQIRWVVQGTLQSTEVPKYKERMVLEALHNCIAHQDYSQNARVTVTEYVDRLVLENRGSFYDGKPEDYILGEHSPSSYRNPQLVKAMRELNMIDTMGYGIHQMYADQKKRYLPLHDYDLTEQSVRMTIYGHVVDEAYSSLLVKRPDLSLEDVCLLDRIQKHLAVTAAAVAHLRREGLIEGRMPHPHISAVVAEATGQQAEYMRKKELPGSRYRAMLIDYIRKFNGLTRKQINDYMIPEIRGELSIEEKMRKITNLLTYLRQKGEIKNIGTDRKPLWVLSDSNVNSNVMSERYSESMGMK